MSDTAIQVEVRGPITVVTLNRPQVLNALNRQMHARLQEVFDEFAADPSQRIGVITGSGERAFCAGSDLKEAAHSGDLGAAPYPRNGYAGLIERFDLNKPLIARVNGLAFGGGFEIALACDLIVAAENARFALPEPLVGAVALGGGLHRLPRQIGLKAALGIILTGRQVSAAEAQQLGIVNEVVPSGDLQAATQRWCERLLRCSPVALRASKETVMRGLDELTLADAMRNQSDYPTFAEWRGSPDRREGPKAFAEKREPPWRQGEH